MKPPEPFGLQSSTPPVEAFRHRMPAGLGVGLVVVPIAVISTGSKLDENVLLLPGGRISCVPAAVPFVAHKVWKNPSGSKPENNTWPW